MEAFLRGRIARRLMTTATMNGAVCMDFREPVRVLPQPAVDAAAYEIAREFVRRPLDSAEKDLLARVNASLEETRGYFKNGRCNVRPDIDNASFNTWRMKVALNHVLRQLARWKPEEYGSPGMEAGVIAHVGAGACRQHAYVSAFSFIARRKETESIVIRSNEAVDHVWVLVTDKKTGTSVVHDSWCEGMAITVADSRYERKQGTTDLLEIDAGNATRAKADFEKGRDCVGPRLGGRIDSTFQALEKRGDELPEEAVWDAEPVLSQRFAREIDQRLDPAFSVAGKDLSGPDQRRHARALDAGKSDTLHAVRLQHRLSAVRLELFAACAARRQGMTSVQDIVENARRIFNRARDIRAPIPRVMPKTETGTECAEAEQVQEDAFRCTIKDAP